MASPSAARKLEVEVVRSIPLGMLQVLHSAAGTPGFLPATLQALDQRGALSEEERALIRLVVPLLREGKGRDAQTDISTVLRQEAFLHSDLGEFLSAIQVRIAVEDHAVLKSAFLALVDDYRTEIWEPAGQAMDRADGELRAQFGTVEAAELFDSMTTFYQALPQRRIRLGLVPLPSADRGGWAALPLCRGGTGSTSAPAGR